MSKSIFDNAVLLNLSVGMPGNHRKVATDDVAETEADHAWIGVSKRLIESEEFDAVNRVQGELKGFIKGKSIFPHSNGVRPALRRFLKPGVYLVPLDLVQEVDDKIQETRGKWQTAIDTFIRAYPKLKDEAKAKLKELYDENDYPEEGQLRASFYLDTSFISVGTPEALQKISGALLKREKEKTRAQLDDVYTEVRQVLRAGFAELVRWMAEILEPGADGRKRQFRQTSVEKFMAFLTDFKAKNLTGDGELEALVEQTKGILAGHDADSLREAAKSENFREELAAEFGKLKGKLDPLVAKTPLRKITLQD